MSEQSYPGPADPAGGQEYATPVDGELLDPVPSAGAAEDDHAVIDGEAIDVDESDADADADDRDEPVEVVDVTDADGADDADASGSADVLVLESWQIAIPATGDATVDAALARLADVEGLPPSQHADVYEAVHAGLHEALADLDRS